MQRLTKDPVADAFALLFETELQQGAPDIARLWQDAVRKHVARSPNAYVHTEGFSRAFNLAATLKTFKAMDLPGGGIGITGAIILDGQQVLAGHQAQQTSGGIHGIPHGAIFVKSGKNPKDLGLVGSLQPQRKPYLVPYLAAGPNEPNQPAVYKVLGNKGISTRRDINRGKYLLEAFLTSLGLKAYSLGRATIATGTVQCELLPGFQAGFFPLLLGKVWRSGGGTGTTHNRTLIIGG